MRRAGVLLLALAIINAAMAISPQSSSSSSTASAPNTLLATDPGADGLPPTVGHSSPTIGTGAIVGIVMGSAAFVLLVAIVLSVYILRRRRMFASDSNDSDSDAPQPTTTDTDNDEPIKSIDGVKLSVDTHGHGDGSGDEHNDLSINRSIDSDHHSLPSSSPSAQSPVSTSEDSHSPSHDDHNSKNSQRAAKIVNELCVEIHSNENEQQFRTAPRSHLPYHPSNIHSHSQHQIAVRPVDELSPYGHLSHVSLSPPLTDSVSSPSASSPRLSVMNIAALTSSSSYATTSCGSLPSTHSHTANGQLMIREAKIDADYNDSAEEDIERERQLRSLFESLRIDAWHTAPFLSNRIGVNELTLLSPHQLAAMIPSLRPRRFLQQYINERNGHTLAGSDSVRVLPSTVAEQSSRAPWRQRRRQQIVSPSTRSVTQTPFSHIETHHTHDGNDATVRGAASVTVAPITTSISITHIGSGPSHSLSTSRPHSPISHGSGSQAVTLVSRSTVEPHSPTFFSISSRSTRYAQLNDNSHHDISLTGSQQQPRTVSVSINHLPSHSGRVTNTTANSRRPQPQPQPQQHQTQPTHARRSSLHSLTQAPRSQFREFEPSIMRPSQVFSMGSANHQSYYCDEESQIREVESSIIHGDDTTLAGQPPDLDHERDGDGVDTQ